MINLPPSWWLGKTVDPLTVCYFVVWSIRISRLCRSCFEIWVLISRFVVSLVNGWSCSYFSASFTSRPVSASTRYYNKGSSRSVNMYELSSVKRWALPRNISTRVGSEHTTIEWMAKIHLANTYTNIWRRILNFFNKAFVYASLHLTCHRSIFNSNEAMEKILSLRSVLPCIRNAVSLVHPQGLSPSRSVRREDETLGSRLTTTLWFRQKWWEVEL